MQPPNPSKNHHHVPQFYLGRWVDPSEKPERLWYYRRERGKLIQGKISPKKTAYEEHLYTARPTTAYEDWREDLIETSVMSPLDDAAAKVLEKLTSDERPIALDDAERKAWARYLNSLLERHPRELGANDAKAKRIGDELMATYADRWTARGDQERVRRALDLIRPHDMARTIVRQHMLGQINDPTVLDYLVDQEWTVCGPIGDEQFITSDRPILVDAKDGQTRPIRFLSLAVSPQHLFVSHPKSWLSEPEQRDQGLLTLAAAHNHLIVLAQPRFLYAAAPIADGERVRLRSLVEKAFGMAEAALEP